MRRRERERSSDDDVLRYSRHRDLGRVRGHRAFCRTDESVVMCCVQCRSTCVCGEPQRI